MTRSQKKGNRWADHYTRRAQKENFPARSVYKLQEIQKKQPVIGPGDRVLDLGCAPGSWLLYAAQLIGAKGQVVGVDLKPVTQALPENVHVRQQDAFALCDPDSDQSDGRFHVVLSDMAPDTTGSKHVDAARSAGLSEAALAVACRVLVPGGNFVCKIFQGPDFKAFTEAVRAEFSAMKIFKPQSSRKASREIFVIGLGKKQEAVCQDTANGRP
ncbi:MAG: RlmE family RNA methyltransferase [Desulfobacterales bacterium]|nr:RlmE family RNA methyltransferase [Desulfobacterales bacterium]